MIFFFFKKGAEAKNDKNENGWTLFWCGSNVRKLAKESMNVSSLKALIPCRKPKSNRNNNGEKYN